jgi:hypothetical protein
MRNHLSILEEAIADVGYWRWWADSLPRVFQVEFGGVQLYFPSASADKPSNGVVALRFLEPSLVAFLTASEATTLEPDWRVALHEDRCEPFTIDHELFTLTSVDALEAVAAGCNTEFVLGTDLGPSTEGDAPLLAFRAQDVGLIVRAKEMRVIAAAGELSPEQVSEAYAGWWKYWREYWDRRDSDTPMPKDYACEVTIPIKDE